MTNKVYYYPYKSGIMASSYFKKEDQMFIPAIKLHLRSLVSPYHSFYSFLKLLKRFIYGWIETAIALVVIPFSLSLFLSSLLLGVLFAIGKSDWKSILFIRLRDSVTDLLNACFHLFLGISHILLIVIIVVRGLSSIIEGCQWMVSHPVRRSQRFYEESDEVSTSDQTSNLDTDSTYFSPLNEVAQLERLALFNRIKEEFNQFIAAGVPYHFRALQSFREGVDHLVFSLLGARDAVLGILLLTTSLLAYIKNILMLGVLSLMSYTWEESRDKLLTYSLEFVSQIAFSGYLIAHGLFRFFLLIVLPIRALGWLEDKFHEWNNAAEEEPSMPFQAPTLPPSSPRIIHDCCGGESHQVPPEALVNEGSVYQRGELEISSYAQAIFDAPDLLSLRPPSP